MEKDKSLIEHRTFIRANWGELEGIETDQNKKLPPLPIQKPYDKNAKLINLIAPKDIKLGKMNVYDAIINRKSRRKFTDESITIEELSYLLWATQGINKKIRADVAFRTVPSAGARHSFETYLYIRKVEDIEEGLYRYLPEEHKLLMEYKANNLKEKVDYALLEQLYNASVVFIWSTIPYRMEWRYHKEAHKLIALDAGHVCQNLYIACESIKVGTFAIGAYDQKELDDVIRVDGIDEFAIYAAPVGRYVEGNDED